MAYRDLVRLVVGRQRGPDFATEADALAWLDAERLNLIAAFGYAAPASPGEHAVRLADALRGYFWPTSTTMDWFATASTAVTVARRAATGAARPRCCSTSAPRSGTWTGRRRPSRASSPPPNLRELGADDGAAASLQRRLTAPRTRPVRRGRRLLRRSAGAASGPGCGTSR